MLYIFNDKFRKFLKGKGLCIIQTGHLVMHKFLVIRERSTMFSR